MMKIEQVKPTDYSFNPQLLATLIASLSIAFFSNITFAQGLSVIMTEDLVPSVDPISRVITELDTDFGAYDQRQIEPLQDLGRRSQSAGDFQQALSFFRQALHVSRVNKGLYHESQISIIDSIISSEVALKNWEEVNNYYAYQEHLYLRLYASDDLRLEQGLKKMSNWHITAFNVNLDGNRIQHLRKANKLFKLRMRVAQNTLSLGDPRFSMLEKNIKICERELFLASDLNREMRRRHPRQQVDSNPRRPSYSESKGRVFVSVD
ncbi:MAG: hypothetical protein P8R01_06615 [Gammaproteobacteria bacterium]|nr:hypothetical protein [Gammaproteobacteria bacterium]